MDEEQLDALRSSTGRALLNELMPYSVTTALAVAGRARAEHPADLVAAAMTQARLRTKAVDRLGAQAGALWFTPDGLEQATRPAVSRHRASHLHDRGAICVADLGCGLGLDAIAMAAAGIRVVALERDPLTAAIARANAEELDLDHAISVITGDAESFDVAGHGCDAVFVDPARRGGGRRIDDPEHWEPSFSSATRMATTTRLGCLKVAPGIDHGLPPATATTEWISDHGDLVEACVWLGEAADTDVRRRATMLPSTTSISNADLPHSLAVGPLGRYLVEPDDAVIRAGLVAVVADRIGGWLLDPAIAYVTCDERPADSALYAAFEVVESLPFSVKALRHRVRALGIGRVEVKKRGSAVDPEDLRRQLRLDASAPGSAVIMLTRIGQNPVAVIARRLASTLTQA